MSVYNIGQGCQIIVFPSITTDEQAETFRHELEHAKLEQTGFGCFKSRRESCAYTAGTRSYRYSGQDHKTYPYPAHVEAIIPLIKELVKSFSSFDGKLVHDMACNVLYSPKYHLGGSIRPHSDNEDDWPIVAIISYDRPRYMRFRRIDGTGRTINLPLMNNSLVLMVGDNFLTTYTHAIDKLRPHEQVGYRKSINIRFKKQETSSSDEDEDEDEGAVNDCEQEVSSQAFKRQKSEGAVEDCA